MEGGVYGKIWRYESVWLFRVYISGEVVEIEGVEIGKSCM